jgi:hypothetical protein
MAQTGTIKVAIDADASTAVREIRSVKNELQKLRRATRPRWYWLAIWLAVLVTMVVLIDVALAVKVLL